MPSYYLEIEYTRHDGTKFHEMGTHIIATVDGRLNRYNASQTLINNARFIASGHHPKVTLLGVFRSPLSGRSSDTPTHLPDGRKNVVIIPMTLEERREYLANGGKVHP